jgi:hypothetical protein
VPWFRAHYINSLNDALSAERLDRLRWLLASAMELSSMDKRRKPRLPNWCGEYRP